MAEDETIVSEGDFSIIRDKFELEKKLPFIIKQLEKWDYSEPCGVKIGVYVNATVKSKSQSDLFHVWCREMERRWISKRPDCTGKKHEDANETNVFRNRGHNSW
jgi:hypothetical protein